jgi:hypothetical protein
MDAPVTEVTVDAGNGAVLAQQAQDPSTRPMRPTSRRARTTSRTDHIGPKPHSATSRCGSRRATLGRPVP